MYVLCLDSPKYKADENRKMMSTVWQKDAHNFRTVATSGEGGGEREWDLGEAQKGVSVQFGMF